MATVEASNRILSNFSTESKQKRPGPPTSSAFSFTALGAVFIGRRRFSLFACVLSWLSEKEEPSRERGLTTGASDLTTPVTGIRRPLNNQRSYSMIAEVLSFSYHRPR